MEPELGYPEAARRRALAAARLADCCLEWDLPHAALVTARAAARAALLALAETQRHPAGPDAELLAGLASLSLGDPKASPGARKVLANTGMRAIDRLLGPVWPSAPQQDWSKASTAVTAAELYPELQAREEPQMIRGVWRTKPGGSLSAEVADYRLIVEAAHETDGMVRFQVLSRGAGSELSSGTVLGAGFERDVRSAMQSAERMADRAFGRLLRL